jgi:UPF0716 protein FxsA
MMLSEKQTGRRARPWPFGLILLAALVVVPLAEIAVLIEVGGWLGLAPTLALLVLTALVGIWLLRRQGIAVLRRAQQQMLAGAVPVAPVFEGFCLVIAGALLLAPGFLTDTLGALLLLPPLRALLYRAVQGRFEAQLRAAPPPRPHARRPDAPVIDVEFEEVDFADMPRPRGSWGRRR